MTIALSDSILSCFFFFFFFRDIKVDFCVVMSFLKCISQCQAARRLAALFHYTLAAHIALTLRHGLTTNDSTSILAEFSSNAALLHLQHN